MWRLSQTHGQERKIEGKEDKADPEIGVLTIIIIDMGSMVSQSLPETLKLGHSGGSGPQKHKGRVVYGLGIRDGLC